MALSALLHRFQIDFRNPHRRRGERAGGDLHLIDADRAALCERCMNPHVLKDQDELDDVCAQCPLEKTAG